MISKSKMTSAHLKVAPNLQILKIMDPGNGQSPANVGETLLPLTQIGFKFHHENHVYWNANISFSLDDQIKHSITSRLS